MYTGTTKFWFTNIIEDAENNLIVGRTYTVKKVEMYSSWSSVELEQHEGLIFPQNWFEKYE